MAKIPKAELERTLEHVLFALKGLPQGAALETIRTHLDEPLPERAVSRYLALLQ